MIRTGGGQKVALIFFGVVLFLTLLEGGMRLCGFIISSFQENRNRVSLKQVNAFRIMCLGESTTAEGGADAYPSQLEVVLNQGATGRRFSVINKGVRATNTSVILSELEGNIATYKPDMVITMMGINDSGRHMPHDMPTYSRALSCFRSLKVYTLFRYLWMHLNARLKETDLSVRGMPACYAAQAGGDAVIASLEQAIRQDPHSETPYVQLGNYYRDTKQEILKAEALYRRALVLLPGSFQLHLELARLYRDQVRYEPAVQYYKKALGLDPDNKYALVELGRFYRDQLKYVEAQELLNQAAKRNLAVDGVYRELAWYAAESGDLARAEALYKKAIEIDPHNAYNYIEFGRFCYNENRKEYAQAEENFQKAIAIDPAEDRGGAYHELGRLSREVKKYAQAEDCFKKAIALNPQDEMAYAGLALTYAEEGKDQLSADYYQKAQGLRDNFYNPLTVSNYRGIKKILARHGLPLVCVQYPMRSVLPLKEIFQGEEGAMFVDNERSFKDAVKKASYNEYFVDAFAGDFGHCTRKGNRLLAENVAEVIVRRYFGKN